MLANTWHQHENVYTATLAIVRAVLIEHPESSMFTARIEALDGTILQTYDELPDFETAEGWVEWAAVAAEQAVDPTNPFQLMFDTLDRCAANLARAAHPTHAQRLAYIRTWITNRQTQDHALRIEWQQQSHAHLPIIALEWQALTPTDWYVETPHGRAIIRERRPEKGVIGASTAIMHTAWIVHPSGATYDWQAASIDFMVADQWVQQTLHSLNDPRVAESLLGNSLFTLTICDRLLEDDPDPMHRARIAYIKDMLETVLP